MSLSERDQAAIGRVRRSQKVLPVFLLMVWILGGALIAYQVTVIMDLARPHGVDSLSKLISVVSNIDTSSEQLPRFEVLLLQERDSVTTGLLFMFLLTVFGLSILPLGRLIIRLADSLSDSGKNAGNPS